MKNPNLVALEVGSRVRCSTRWGRVTGTITRILEAYDFSDSFETVHVPAKAFVTVDRVPKRWPYSIPEFAPELSRLRPL
jgi:hypothetical protein